MLWYWGQRVVVSLGEWWLLLTLEPADLLRRPASVFLADLVGFVDFVQTLLLLLRESLDLSGRLVEFSAELCELLGFFCDALIHCGELGAYVLEILRIAVGKLLRGLHEIRILQLKGLESLDHVGKNRGQKLLLPRQESIVLVHALHRLEETLFEAVLQLHAPLIPHGLAEQPCVRLDVLELIVHQDLELGRSRHVLSEERRVLVKSLGLDFADNAPALGDVLPQLATRL